MPTPTPKHDTVFQSDDGGTPDDWTALIVDDAQHGEDLTSGTTYGYRTGANSARYTVADGWCVQARVEAHTTSNGAIFARDDAGTVNLGFGFDGASGVNFVVNGSTLKTLTIASLPTSPTTDTVVIHWAGIPNPLTTGASDAYHNEIRIWNEDNSNAVVGTNFTSAIPDLSTPPDTIWGAADTSGTSAYDTDVIDLAYHARFHSTTEAYRDWISAASAPTLTGDAPIEVPVPDEGSGFGRSPELVGPVHAMAAAASRRNKLLTASPLINTVMLDDPWESGTTPDITQFGGTKVPGETTWYWYGQFSYLCPIEWTYNRLKPWVHVQMNDTGTGGPYTFNCRVYSMSAHPYANDLSFPGIEPLDTVEYYYSEKTLAADHGNGTTGGAWMDFDPTLIARMSDGEHTLIGLAIKITGGTTPSENEFRIRALSLEPLFVEEASSTIPLDMG